MVGLGRTVSEKDALVKQECAGDAVFRTRREVSFSRGTSRIVDWIDGQQTINLENTYMISLAIAARPGRAWGKYVNGSRGNGRIGRVFLIPPGHPIQAGASESVLSLSCRFDADLIDELLPTCLEWNEAALADSLDIHDAQISNLLVHVYKATKEEDGFASALLVESLIHALTILIVRRFMPGTPVTNQNVQAGGLAPWRIRRIRDRVYADLPLPTVSELATLCGISARQISRGFKTTTGQTLAQFTTQAMIERSHELLLNPAFSTSDVARELGYSSASSFAAAFQRATGFLPSQLEGRRHRIRSRPCNRP